MKTTLRPISVALGITSIYLLWLLGPLITSTHDSIYHWDGPPSQLFIPPIFDFCAFWLLLALVLIFARGRLRTAIWCGIIALTPWVYLKNCGYMAQLLVPHWLSILVLVLGLSAVPLLLALWRSKFEEKFKKVVRFASMLFIVSSFYGVVILFQYAWFGWQARSLNTALPLHHAVYDAPAQAGRSRIIWIVFDELSYKQAYERRFPGLQLPALDALAAQATVFSHTIPAGIMTEKVLPSLLTGEPVDAIRPSPNGSLSIHAGAWKRFDEHDTVFQDALNLDYSTAVAGWFNPYCRLLPDVLDHCFWSYRASAGNSIAPGVPWQSNIMNPLMRFFKGGLNYRAASLFVHIPTSSELDAEQHLSDYLALAGAADRILENQSVGFALLHLPVPHPGGIYDRTTGKFVLRDSSYIDNLALTDKLLGHIRAELERRGEWNTSTIVIMGDHSWRTKMFWKGLPDWTKQDQAANEGGFDDRPAYIVKLPDEHTGARIDAPFAALNTRRLFDALLSRKIRSKEELSAWAKQQ